MAQTSVGHVFMSYSRKDEAVMQHIATFLREQGINVWVDNEKLVPGTAIWEAEIEKAIKAASAIIVVLSPDSKNSEWVRREITLADQYRIRIFPVLVCGDEEASITLRLITRQYVDIRQNDVIGLNSLSTELSRYLKELEAREQRVREDVERLAREKAEREAAEKAAREKAEREATEKAAKEKAEREAVEKTAQKKAEREAIENAAKEKAEHKIAEKVEYEKAQREDEEKQVNEKAKWKASEKKARERAEQEATLLASPKKTEQNQKIPWMKYAILGFIVLCLITIIGGVWKISSSIQKQIDSFPVKVNSGPKPTSSLPTPFVFAGTPLPFTPVAITPQNADKVVQLVAKLGISVFLGQVVYSPDGKMIAVKELNKINLYEVISLTQISFIETEKGFLNVEFSPDGSILASGTSDGAIQLFLVKDGTILQTLSGHTDTVQSVAFSPDGAILASGSGDHDNNIQLWQVNDGTLLQTFDGYKSYSSKASIAFSPDGSLLASSGSGDDSIWLWRVSDGSLLETLKAGTSGVDCLAFSPDGSLLASGSGSTIKLWQMSDGNLLNTLDVGASSLAFSPDGSILASGSGNTIKLWQMSDGNLLNTLVVDVAISNVDFSPDGTTIVSSDTLWGAVRLWGIPR